MITTLVWILISYLLGSIPMGVLLARLKGRDPRNVGSGNIGATNVMRAAGKTLGLVTLLGDVFKGFLPVWLALSYGLTEWAVSAVGFAAFLGHLFPVFLRFRGGKGVATAVGVLLALNPLAVLMDVAVFAGFLAIWRFVSLASLISAALMPLLFMLFHAPSAYVISCAFMTLLIFVRHKENIKRLLTGKESKIGHGSKI